MIMSIKNDRLVYTKNRQHCQKNISLVLESSSAQKILQKEIVNEFYINNDNV